MTGKQHRKADIRRISPLVMAAVILLPSVCAAQTCGAALTSISNGTTADASQVMGNFNILNSCLTGISNSSGKIGIGNSSPQSPLSVSGQVVIGPPYRGDASLQISTAYGGFGRLTQIAPVGISAPALNLMASTDSAGNYGWWAWGVNNNAWTINAGTGFGNSFTIDAGGRVGIGNSPGGWIGNALLSAEGNTGWVGSLQATGGTGTLLMRTETLNAPYFMYMMYGGTTVGAVWTNGTSTVYATTSDYRLKTNIEPLAGGLDRVMALNPIRYNFKAAPQAAKVDGFLAHEVAAVVPSAVVGAKDAVNSDGSISPQMVDYSKLVPLLVAAVQAEQKEIMALKAQIAALSPGP